MGRRPNPLVVEFFERGPKVSDNSNRYEHTCKRCGAVFPKGRVDALITHLLRKCSQVTDQDRQMLFQQLSSPAAQQQHPQVDDKQTSATQTPLTLRQEDLPGLSLPAYQQHEQSALDTLAEVSRRHLDYSSPAAPAHNAKENGGKTLSEILAEQVLITELSNYDATPQKVSTSQVTYPSTSTTLDPSPLVQAATAASKQLELAQATQNHDDNHGDLPLDPQQNTPQESRQFVEGTNDFTEYIEDDSTLTWVPRKVNRLKDPPNAPEGAPTPGFGLLHLPKIGNKRKRFDVDRRKEVSDLRKQGACIRCRMLKKPCSGDDPCTTCQTVQSARLWKAKCLRTRLADEFTLWSSNLFQAKMNAELSGVAQRLSEAAAPVRVEARIPSAAGVGFNFAAKAYGDAASSLAEESSGLVLLDDSETSSDRFEHYSDQLVITCAESEMSAFMKATVQQAQAILAAECVSAAATDGGSKSSRSCYSLQDQLLKNVLELWALTRILTSPPSVPWTLRFTSVRGDERPQHEGNTSESLLNHELQPIPESSPSHSLMTSQLLASIEFRCGKLGKIIMNELERRLLQRQQVSPFATFLSAVILLACVERMTGLFRAFDMDEVVHASPTNQDGTTQVDEARVEATENNTQEITLDEEQESTSPEPGSWPLSNPPSTYWSQGQNFSELLAMLLRMRALPPKTFITPLGTLSTNPEFRPPLRINGRAVKEYVDPPTKAAATAWLDPLRLQVAELVEKRDSEMRSREQGVEGWEMKFVAMLLLPENVG